MAEKKRKTREETNTRQSKSLTLEGKKKKKKNNKRDEQGKSGPRLSSAIRKELGLFNPNPRNSDEEFNSDNEEVLGNHVYEYEEPMPEEESKKNRRFDPVENLEYKLSDEFEDENVSSDDDINDVDDDISERNNIRDDSDQSGDEVEKGDVGRHARMLQGITGMPAEAFEGKKKKNAVVSEAYPESEYNPSREALDGDGRISVKDLLDPLHGKLGYSKLRKRMQQLERKSISVQAPLPKVDREKMERKVAYEHSKKDITKWEPLVKRNREAPTIFFNEDIDLGVSTVGAIASEFEPRTDFEKKIASLVRDPKVVDAHKEDGARLLELNKISIEDVKDRQNRLAKMRCLLFRHEMKSKHIKKIKSKTYHRLLKKDRLKAAGAAMQMDPEAAKEHAMKQEFKRAEERMTLKHKNSSKWAKRILKRGLNAQDEGTRAAISEQLHQHALLTRKMNSMKDSSSSDDSSDEDDDDELSLGTDQDGASKLLTKAKENTMKAIEEEDEMPKSGVLSLPFMVRGLKKRKEEAYAEAKLALEEYDSSLKELEDTNIAGSPKIGSSSGRRVFGAARKQPEELNNRIKSDNVSGNSDSEDDFETKKDADAGFARTSQSQKDVHIDTGIHREEPNIVQEPVFKTFDDVRDSAPKTTYEVAIFASGSWKKMKSENVIDGNNKEPSRVIEPALPHHDLKEVDEDIDTESGEEMVDGMLSSGTKQVYELPSQADLIHRAFAGDDVEEEFEKDKLEILKEENPDPEKPVLLPGWGQWTNIQRKKGLPSWMLEEHENAKKKREEALKKRKDAHLKHVIISEKINKKAEKLHTKTLPFPYTSKEVFEQSIRVPIGPEFNPATSIRALNRPEVVKKSGVIIKPIKFEEINPHEKAVEDKWKGQMQKTENKNSGAKAIKKMKTREKKAG